MNKTINSYLSLKRGNYRQSNFSNKTVSEMASFQLGMDTTLTPMSPRHDFHRWGGRHSEVFSKIRTNMRSPKIHTPIATSFYIFEVRGYLNETTLAVFSNERHLWSWWDRQGPDFYSHVALRSFYDSKYVSRDLAKSHNVKILYTFNSKSSYRFLFTFLDFYTSQQPLFSAFHWEHNLEVIK